MHMGATWRIFKTLQEKSFLTHSQRTEHAKWMARIAGFLISSQFTVQAVKESLLSKPTLSSLSVSLGLGITS